MTQRIALGVMARAPVPGRCKTRLARVLGAEGAARLYEAMLRDSLDAFEKTAAPRLVVMAAPEDDGVAELRAIAPAAWEVIAQRGQGLGARLVHAATTLGAEGDALILVSSDSPTVPIGPMRAALATFAGPRRALLGPCEDGGYYAIGLTSLELGVFEQITWSTASVLTETRARCSELGLQVRELPAGYDVDEPADLDRLRSELAAAPSRAPRTAELLGALGGERRR